MDRIAARGIPLEAAASAIGAPKELVDRLVRKQLVLGEPLGKRGKGGRLQVHSEDLVYLWAAVRLAELHVPPRAIRSYVVQLRALPDRAVVIHEPGGGSVKRWSGFDPELQASLERGATVEIVDTDAIRRKIEPKLVSALITGRARGRPKVDIQWLREGLDASDELGSDETTERIKELTRPARQAPLRRG